MGGERRARSGDTGPQAARSRASRVRPDRGIDFLCGRPERSHCSGPARCNGCAPDGTASAGEIALAPLGSESLPQGPKATAPALATAHGRTQHQADQARPYMVCVV